MLYSNNRLLPANIEIDRGLREAIVRRRIQRRGVRGISRPARVLGSRVRESFARYLREKYVARPPQVLVVAGRAGARVRAPRACRIVCRRPGGPPRRLRGLPAIEPPVSRRRRRRPRRVRRHGHNPDGVALHRGPTAGSDYGREPLGYRAGIHPARPSRRRSSADDRRIPRGPADRCRGETAR